MGLKFRRGYQVLPAVLHPVQNSDHKSESTKNETVTDLNFFLFRDESHSIKDVSSLKRNSSREGGQ